MKKLIILWHKNLIFSFILQNNFMLKLLILIEIIDVYLKIKRMKKYIQKKRKKKQKIIFFYYLIKIEIIN